MLNRRRLLKFLIPTLLPLGIMTIAVSCSNGPSNTGGQNQKTTNQDSFQANAATFFVRVNEKVHRPFEEDITSQAYSLDQNTLLYGSLLFQLAASGQTKATSEGVISEKSKNWHKLVHAEKVYLTLADENGQEKVVVYDNDKVDKWVAHPSNPSVDMGESSDPKSINNPKFLEDLKKTKKMQVTIKKGNFWVNSRGEKTQYEVKAEDFWTKYARTFLRDNKARHEAGGSKELDEMARNKYKGLSPNPGSNPFDANGEYSNEYLLNIFNIDYKALKHKEKFLQKTSEENPEQALTFMSAEGQKGMYDFFRKVFLDTNIFTAAPTDYIKDNKATKDIAQTTGLVSEVGYYWYGEKPSDFLSAGPYYLSSANADRRIFVQNKHFLDQDWVKNENALRRLTFFTTTQNVQAYAREEFEEYKEGNRVTINWNTLDSAQKLQIIDNPQKFNLNYRKPLDNSSIRIAGNNNFVANPGNQPSNKRAYQFSDAYSKLVYGAKTTELSAETSPVVNKHFWTGDSLIFRTLISNAFNIHKYGQLNRTTESVWIPTARPDALINGSNHASSQFKTLADAKDMNSLFALGYNEQNKIIKFGKKTIEEDRKYFIANPDNDIISSRSSTWEQLQKQIKQLLDKFYQANTEFNPQDENGKISANFYEVPLAIEERILTTAKIVENINRLDPRLNFKVIPYNENDTSQDLREFRAPTRWSGWGYDYDGYGGFLGMVLYPNSRFQFLTLLWAFGALDENHELAKIFPQVYKLAKEIKNNKKLFPEGARSFEEIQSATAKDLSIDIIKYLKKNKSDDFDVIGEYAKFAKEYQDKTTNEDLIALTKEFNVLFGWSPNNDLKHTPKQFLPVLVNKHYQVPQHSLNNLSYYDWRIVKK